MPDINLTYAHCFALSVTAIAAWTDCKRGIIPNWLTLPALCIWPLVHLVSGGLGALVTALFSLAVCALVPLVMFVKGAMGGGDVKLFAALGLALPLETALGLQLLSYLTVATLALTQLAFQGHLFTTLKSTLDIFKFKSRTDRNSQPPPEPTMHAVKMGLGIFVATCVATLDFTL